MLTIDDLLKTTDIGKFDVRLVRHRERSKEEIRISRGESWEEYQSRQMPGKFGNASFIVSFLAGDGTTAVFEGIYEIIRESQRMFSPPHGKPAGLRSFYELKRRQELSEMEGRIIIEWGKATRSWVQKKLDKRVLEYTELAGSHLRIKDFHSYERVMLTWDELSRVYENSHANAEWVEKLRLVKGIYLITDLSTGDQYVGAASGESGFWGRWATYAATGHGGNVLLKSLDYTRFQFSILRTAEGNLTAREILGMERLWKEKLGSRTYGLNLN